jgi:hypothetical protein
MWLGNLYRLLLAFRRYNLVPTNRQYTVRSGVLISYAVLHMDSPTAPAAV